MKIAVIGAGAIGGLIAGYLKDKAEDVFLVGRRDSLESINKRDLSISGVRGTFQIRIDIFDKLNKKVDLVIFAVKTQDIEEVVKDNKEYLNDMSLLTTENGVQADKILSRYFPQENIISSIVMFGSTYLGSNEIVHNFEGKWILGRPYIKNDDTMQKITTVLNKIFPTLISDDIIGMKWLKIFVNANNCLAAILGKSMQETFRSLEICKISIRIWQEGLEVVNKAGVKLVSLPDFPLEKLTKLTAMPIDDSAKIFSGIMTNLSKEPLYGSILQSIKRNRPSEIDYINGEFVSLARANGIKAFLNENLVKLVHRVEQNKQFLSQEELLENTREFL